MFFCIGESSSENYSLGKGETIEEAISNWSTSRNIWGDILDEFNRYDPVIIQGQELNIELECPPPIVRIKECFE